MTLEERIKERLNRLRWLKNDYMNKGSQEGQLNHFINCDVLYARAREVDFVIKELEFLLNPNRDLISESRETE